MSSVISQTRVLKDTPLKFNGYSGPFYVDDVLDYMPFPFTFTNGVLDILLIDNFEAQMIDVPGQEPQIGSNEDTRLIKLFGGNGVVTSLGPNFIRYIKAWRDSTIDADTPINIYTPCVMTKIQTSPSNQLYTSESYQVSTQPPSSDEYVWGDSTNNWRTTWIFKTPLTITTIEGGVKQYITLSSFLGPDYG